MKRDNIIFDIIEKEHQRQLKGIELIASENFVSDQVMQAMGSCMTNKYAEGYPGKRYYGGCEIVDQSETIAIERLKKLFNAEWANVQPHSGAQANAAVFFAVLNPGDTFLGLNLAHGGHLSHGSPVNSSGILYHATEYNVKEETGRVDYDQMEEVALREKPKLIIGGGSAYSREWDYKRMREIADKVGALLMIDMAHPAGLIAAGLLNNPLEYAHIVTSTTHKTLRGPRGGIILMGKDFENPWGKKTPKGEIKKMSQLLDSAVFPGTQGGPLEHVIAAKAVAFGEALEPEFKTYQAQVKANAATMAQAFIDKGYKIISGGTDNHSMLIDLRTKFPDLTGKVAEKALVAADITVNKNMVPFDSRSAFQTSGIRVGTPAITTRGAKEPLMGEIVELIDTVLAAPECDKTITAVREKVNSIMKSLQPGWDSGEFTRLLNTYQLPEKKLIKDMSKGMRMKFRLATALAHKPRLLILDEATSGLDPVVRGEVLDYLRDYIQDENHSVLMSSHITSDLEKVADSIAYLHKGKLLFQMDRDELLEKYGVLRCSPEQLEALDSRIKVATRKTGFTCETLVSDVAAARRALPDAVIDRASTEDIMQFYTGRDAQ